MIVNFALSYYVFGSWIRKKICLDPIDYESIEKIEFWITKEDNSLLLDCDELEKMLYDNEAIPRVVTSLEEG